MINEKMINTTQLQHVTLDDLKTTITFSSGLGDVIKWQLLGLYIKNDDLEIEQLENLFRKSGAFYEQRFFKTQAQYVFKALSNNEPLLGETHKLSDIAKVTLENRPFSIGVAYTQRPKVAKAPVDPRLKAAKRAISDGTAGPIKNAKQLLELADMGIPEIEKIIANSTVKNNIDTIAKEFPDFTTDNLNKIVTMTKEYLSEMFTNHPVEFEQITDHILDLQSTPVAEEIAA